MWLLLGVIFGVGLDLVFEGMMAKDLFDFVNCDAKQSGDFCNWCWS